MTLTGWVVGGALVALAGASVANGAEARAALTVAAAAPANLVDLAPLDAAIASGKLNVARHLLERAKLAGQAGPDLDLRLAEYALASGAAPQAAAAFEALTAIPGAAAAAWQGVGLVALASNDTPRAATAFAKALALDAGLPRAWNAVAVIADRRGDWTTAEAAYARALALTPGDANLLSNRAYSRLLQARYADALADVERALRLAPKLEVAHNNRRLALALSGDYGAAFAGADRRDLLRDLNTVGFGAMLRGDYAAARGYFTRALAINPELDRTAWRNLAYLNRIEPRASAPALKFASGDR